MALVPSWLSRKSSVFDPFSMNVWDPSETFVPVIPRDTSSADKDVLPVANARIDWKETGEAHIFKADLPGLNKDEVKIEVEDGRVLQISGERKREKEEKNERWHCLERVHGRFIRRFRLPDNGNLDEIKATMENGLLTVTVPKKPQPQPAVKQIDISGN